MAPRASSPRFRKIFVVFMILVAVPSLAISGFGIMAIMDARAVAESRLKESYNARLRALASDLAVSLARMESLHPADEHITSDALTRLQADRVRTLLPDLARHHFPSEGTVVELTSDDELKQQGAQQTAESFRARMEEWMKNNAETRDFLGQDPVAELRLPPPLSQYRLHARLAGDELLASQVRTTAVIYTLLLIAFYLLLIAGVTVVSVSMYREVQLGRLKTDFVSHVSHELRTPLTSIRMFLETLLMGRVQSEAEARECLKMCAQETERLSGMIERVLDWARIEAGKRSYDKQPCTAGDVVEVAVGAFRTQILEAPYTLTTNLSGATAPITVDRAALGDALLNLLHNAFKYTGTDKQISVAAIKHGRWVDISVADNGIGIDRSEHKRIFERFYRAEDLLTQRTHGSGLGLALAKRIVEAHGGKILVTSRKGQGSTFTLRIPVARGAPAHALAERTT